MPARIDGPLFLPAGLGRIRLLAESLFSFLDLQRFPVAFHFGRGIGFRVAEHVRMPVYKLAGEPVENVINRKRPLLLGHLRIKKHLQQQVAEFAGQFVPVAIIDGFEDFIGFFQRVGFDGIEGLLAIPGTPPGARKRSMIATARSNRSPVVDIAKPL